MQVNKPNTVEEYISLFPEEVQEILQRIRTTIKAAAPEAEEVISYQMPAYKYNGMLVYFAAYKQHIGFYPTASGIANFKTKLSNYKGAKGSIQFPLNKPIPFALIAKIVKFRVSENIEKVNSKKSLKICSEGHKYYKSSDCPTCPICEQESKPKGGFLSLLSAPARRALENNGVRTLKQLAKYSEADILKFHGLGLASIPKLREALKVEGLSFKNNFKKSKT